MIQNELDECEKAFEKGAHVFLVHLSRTHAVGQKVFAEGCTNDKEIRKVINKFIQVTSPDKHRNDEEHIQLLYNEITTMLLNLRDKDKPLPPRRDADESDSPEDR